MSRKTVTISPVRRVEGESGLLLETEENTIVRAFYMPEIPVRGFERMLTGKMYQFVPDAVMRICGVCHITHAIAAAEALEDCFSVTPPENAVLLRECAGLINRLQSHAVHMAFIVEDFFSGDEKARWLNRTVEMLELSGNAMAILGKNRIHPHCVVVGGVDVSLSEKSLKEIKENVTRYLGIMEEFQEALREKISSMIDDGKMPEELGNVHFPRLTTDMYYGDREKLDLIDVSVHRADRFYNSRDLIDYGCLIATYRDSIVEVGPGARMRLFKNMRPEGPLNVNTAYIADAIAGGNRILEIVDTVDINATMKVKFSPKKGAGIGVHEAPRGTNIHIARTDEDGIIEDYRIIVPTMFNIPVINEALRGSPVEFAELVVRSYDPCISCATHKIVISHPEVRGHEDFLL